MRTLNQESPSANLALSGNPLLQVPKIIEYLLFATKIFLNCRNLDTLSYLVQLFTYFSLLWFALFFKSPVFHIPCLSHGRLEVISLAKTSLWIAKKGLWEAAMETQTWRIALWTRLGGWGDGEGGSYGESNTETYINICKIDGQWKVWLRELKMGLDNNLEGWDGGGWSSGRGHG